jgi:hypothetical protein
MLASINQTQPKDTLMKGIKLNIVFKKKLHFIVFGTPTNTLLVVRGKFIPCLKHCAMKV